MPKFRVCLLLLLSGAVALSAQSPRVFTARLATAPVEAANAATLTGSGAVTATLTGNTLAVIGNYKGLQGLRPRRGCTWRRWACEGRRCSTSR
jgi:hypothetical protein